jgi:RNA polymerase sigma factor (sigma-70 family)
MEIEMNSKDYLVEVKVKNNWLMKKIKDAGYENIAQLSKAHNLNPSEIGEYANFKKTPLNDKGEWRKSFLKLSEILKCMPEDICPPQHLENGLKNNNILFEANAQEILTLTSGNTYTAIPAIEKIIEEEDINQINQSLDYLTPKEKKIIEMRFALGEEPDEKTYEDIGKIYNLSRERIRQIEIKAIRKLRRANDTIKLRDIAKIRGVCSRGNDMPKRHYVPQWKKTEKNLNSRQNIIDRKIERILNDL